MKKITFGTDGWRGIIADDFTFDNVKIVAQAIADYVVETYENPKIIIGYDYRFHSENFAKICAEILSSNGIQVLFSQNPIPTPAVAHAVVKKGASGAIMITASHNPYYYNGIKFIPHYGGPANTQITDKIIKNVERIQKEGLKDINPDKDLIEYFDYKEEYLNDILNLIDKKAFEGKQLKVLVNPMYGCGIGYIDEALRRLGCDVKVINNWRDPLFGGHLPEPNLENMKDLLEIIKTEEFDLGLATDGDADRFGVVNPDGQFISANEVIFMLTDYLINTRGKASSVARTVATTSMIDKIAQKHGMRCIETPVGFKYIAECLMKEDALIGGEESGGLSIKGHVPEKDGILADLLVAEAVAKLEKSPREILDRIESEYGKLYSKRIDVRTTHSKKQEALERIKNFGKDNVAGLRCLEYRTRDGLKVILEDEAWFLVRASGTEDLIRIYAESKDAKTLENILSEVKEYLGL
ncbi:phosphoglucomutase/phosphomannomutase family protein [Caldicellulosiruptor naganoensis]|uniref:Phosphoglucomutase n=1 Tax=Caldicellulosiruptor naganoensis TaxID=29324 RepID=A0ABY7BG35_9FIRM|nr:phosphoglucomutase/phosphomannomutase family protein [Caldicellulosiruptor naganoensis]WAM31061.1 phosphoglucomutase/phosphomannomutase family protein [Caldicellulosiruptor naganoensis]